MNDDTRGLIMGTIVFFLCGLVVWLGIVYISACSFTLNCIQGAPLVVRTSIPTLIPRETSQGQGQPQEAPVAFNKCQVSATDLIGADAIDRTRVPVVQHDRAARVGERQAERQPHVAAPADDHDILGEAGHRPFPVECVPGRLTPRRPAGEHRGGSAICSTPGRHGGGPAVRAPRVGSRPEFLRT